VDIAAATVGPRLDVISLAEDDDLAPRPRPTPALPARQRPVKVAAPTLAEELTAAVGGGSGGGSAPRTTESPYGEQTTFL
jgi:hypothetical protein